MQTINTVQLRQLVQDEPARALQFTIRPLDDSLNAWCLWVDDPDTGNQRIVITYQNEHRRFRQINAAVRFIANHAGKHHHIQINLF